jgi:aspartate kinase
LSKPSVIKFGGTSVADAAAFGKAARIVRNLKDADRIVVVSAMSGVTDTLFNCFELAAEHKVQSAMTSFEEQLGNHLIVARCFLHGDELAQFESTIESTRAQIQHLLHCIATAEVATAALKDELVSFGEYLSATLLASVLQALGVPAMYVDARSVLVTDDEYGRANPLFAETEKRAREKLSPLISLGNVPVLGGFIAATANGQTTTLGRGGSDYSAAIIGAVLKAESIQIWTDVNGVLTADPRVVPAALTIPVLSYQEAAELAYFGAKVLHPKTLQPAIERSIPVRVCNSREPGKLGTLIVAESKATPQTVKAIAHKSGITTVQVTSAGMLGAYGFLRALFEIFARHRTAVDVVTTSEVSVSLSLDDPSSLDQIVVELKRLGSVEIEKRRTIISVIGQGLRNTPGIAASVFSTIRDINVSMISLGASSINLTFMVDDEDAHEAITRLHRTCFETKKAKAAVLTENTVAREVGA